MNKFNGRCNDIPQDWAAALLLAAWRGQEPPTSFFEIRPLHPDGGPATHSRQYVPVARPARVLEIAHEIKDTLNVFVSAAPRARLGGKLEHVDRGWGFWVDADGPEAFERMLAFNPAPSIAILSGSGGGHGHWPVRKALSPQDLQRGNRRLALAIGGDQGATDAARVLRLPGTLNHKHAPAREVRCVRVELDVHNAHDVVGHLADTHHYQPRRIATPRSGSVRLTGLVEAVRTAPEGNRNRMLHFAACRLAEHVAAGELDERQGVEELRNAALDAGLSDSEINATIRSGLNTRIAA